MFLLLSIVSLLYFFVYDGSIHNNTFFGHFFTFVCIFAHVFVTFYHLWYFLTKKRLKIFFFEALSVSFFLRYVSCISGDFCLILHFLLLQYPHLYLPHFQGSHLQYEQVPELRSLSVLSHSQRFFPLIRIMNTILHLFRHIILPRKFVKFLQMRSTRLSFLFMKITAIFTSISL